MPHRHAPQPFPAPAVSGGGGPGGPRPPPPDPFVAERIQPRTTDIRSGSVQSSLICPIFRKDFRGPKDGKAQRARPEEKKTPFRIQQTAYGLSTPFSEEPQGNGYKTNKPGKRKREKPLPSTAARSFRSPLRHALRTASYGARHSAPSTPRTTVPTSGQPYAIGPAPAPNPPPEFPNGEKNTNRHVLTIGSATGSNSVSKKHTENRPVSQYADILVVRPPSPVRAFSGTALSESEGIRPSLPCGRGGGPADQYTRSAPRPTRY